MTERELPWPWPNDTRLDKLRRMMDIYRSDLAEVAPDKCQARDEWLARHGERWIISDEILNMEDLKTARQIYDLMGPGFEVGNILKWAQRKSTGVERRGYLHGSPLFRLGDVLTFQASLR